MNSCRKWFYGLLLMMGLLLFGGCGQKEYSIEEANGRTIVTLDGYVGMNLQKCIDEFNRKNANYYVHHLGNQEDLDYEECMDKRAIQIMTNRSADILMLGGDYRMPQYMEKGALEDLAPYIERDIRKEKYLDGALELFAIGDGVYAVPVMTEINMLLKKCENNNPYEEISFSKLCELLEEKKPNTLFDLPAKDTLWYMYLFFGFDVENTEELTKAIELTEKYRRRDDEEKGMGTDKLEFGKQFLMLDFMISIPDILTDIYVSFGKLGEGISGVNTPVFSCLPLAISSCSEEKEGAWAFLRFVLEDGQDIIGQESTPIRKEAFEKRCDESYTDDAFHEFMGEYRKKLGSTKEEFLLRYNEMMRKGKPRELMTDTYDIWRILWEEAQMYYNGDRSLEATMGMIQNRVGLYRAEKKECTE